MLSPENQQQGQDQVQVALESCEDFIATFNTNYDAQVLVDWYKYTESCGFIVDRGLRGSMPLEQDPLIKRDSGMTLAYLAEKERQSVPPREGFEDYKIEPSHAVPEVQQLNQVVAECVGEYVSHFREAASYSLHLDAFNLQKTIPGQGYHAWHCEDSGLSRDRKLVVMMYLNEDFEGGETEFLYQSKRIKPKTGQVIVWPANFTHTHRGNPPLTGEKYIATSWVCHIPDSRIHV
jgi:hypothetical protein